METRLRNSEITFDLRRQTNSLEKEGFALLSSGKPADKLLSKVETTKLDREFATELEKFVDGNFKNIDWNKDGFLSPKEIALYNLRDDLNQVERKMGKFIVSNYADLSELADFCPFGSLPPRFCRNLKFKPELCMTDLKVLRTASDQKSLQDALTDAHSKFNLADYGAPVALGTCASMFLTNKLVTVVGRRVPSLTMGSLAGGYIGYKADEYFCSADQDNPNDSRRSLPYSVAIGAGSGMLLTAGIGRVIGGRLPLVAVAGLIGAYGAYRAILQHQLLSSWL